MKAIYFLVCLWMLATAALWTWKRRYLDAFCIGAIAALLIVDKLWGLPI